MHEEQKQAVLALRSQGESYAEIAGCLNISQNTIKSFCRRSRIRPSPGISINPDKESPGICKNCGAPLSQMDGRRKKLFCSDRCRCTWWNKERRKKAYRLTCQHCGRTFISLGNRRKMFCSKKCMGLARYGSP